MLGLLSVVPLYICGVLYRTRLSAPANCTPVYGKLIFWKYTELMSLV